jgi:hypothetical protein
MEIFKNLPREILSVIFVFASQMRICEYFEVLKEEVKREYNELKREKLFKINIHYFKIPQIIIKGFWNLDSSLEDDFDFIFKLMDPPYNRDYDIFRCISYKYTTARIRMLGNNILGILVADENTYMSYLIQDIYNPFELEFILKESFSLSSTLDFDKRRFNENKFTQDEKDFIKYLLRNHNRVIYH